MNLLVALFLIVFESVPEALSDKGRKTLAGQIEFIYRLIVTLIVFAWVMGMTIFPLESKNYLVVVAGYVLLRFALFDIIYNLIIGEPVFFIGSTKIYDKIWVKFFAWTRFPVEHFLAIIKVIALFIGTTWLIRGSM